MVRPARSTRPTARVFVRIHPDLVAASEPVGGRMLYGVALAR
ncbi:hypothetical protein [Streptomyces echinatus]|uniref:Uncharacterized protein n=1 Tax=Streptomyces echinatus TaxID=67293 RepID=A0A7W9PRS0_9ACTN|nr:hypothetical protein [Streptomyces echinatus]MBB5926651.1 hypothetical protein [Streptomyces echinatus]